MHFKVVVAKAPSHSDGGQHPCLKGKKYCKYGEFHVLTNEGLMHVTNSIVAYLVSMWGAAIATTETQNRVIC